MFIGRYKFSFTPHTKYFIFSTVIVPEKLWYLAY